MVKCPRCEFTYDETQRTTCPLCFTPAPGAAPGRSQVPAPPQAPNVPPLPGAVPMPPSPQPMSGPPGIPQRAPEDSGTPGVPMSQGGLPGVPQMPTTAPPMSGPASGEMRVSLTGEVIHSNAPSGPPPSYVGGPSAIPSVAGRPAGPARPTSGSRRMESAPARSGSAGPIIAILLVLAALGAGAFWFLKLRTSPKDQLTKYIAAQRKLDFNTMASLTEIDSQEFPTAQAWIDKQNEGLNRLPAGLKDQIIKSLENADIQIVGEPKMDGNMATLKVKTQALVNGSYMGMKFSQPVSDERDVIMKNIYGTWKVAKENKTIGNAFRGAGASGGGVPTGMPGGGFRRGR